MTDRLPEAILNLLAEVNGAAQVGRSLRQLAGVNLLSSHVAQSDGEVLFVVLLFLNHILLLKERNRGRRLTG